MTKAMMKKKLYLTKELIVSLLLIQRDFKMYLLIIN